MKLLYLDDMHCIDASIVPKNGTFMKIGVMGITDLITFRKAFPSSFMISYEADDYNYEKYFNRFVNVSYNKAVSDSNDTVLFYKYKTKESNSIFPRHKKGSNRILDESIKTPSVNIKTAINQDNIENLDVLIMNCEGGEIPVAKDIASGLYKKITQMCIQFHHPRIYNNSIGKEAISLLSEHYNIQRVGTRTDVQKNYLFIRK